MAEADDEEEVVELEDRENQSIGWDEAVERGKILHLVLEQQQWRLGKLVSKVCTVYGEETLQRFADDIEIPYETLKRYRSVWRAWEKFDGRPARYSVGRALARIPDRVEVFNSLVNAKGDEGWVTEEAALRAAKEYRENRSAGKYKDFPLHKMVSRACRILNAIAYEDGELDKLLTDVSVYTSVDFEYVHKIVEALNGAILRLTVSRDVFLKMTTKDEEVK